MGSSGSSEWGSRWLGSPGLGAEEGIQRKYAGQESEYMGPTVGSQPQRHLGLWAGSSRRLPWKDFNRKTGDTCRGHKVGLSGQMSVHHFGVV